jgi:hypothetical protein
MQKKRHLSMNSRIVILASFTVALLMVTAIGGQNLSAYAAYSNAPSLGGGKLLQYSDGLVLNGKTIDISKYSQKMTTPQVLALGKPSTFTVKIFDNDGPTTIMMAALYMNMHGANLATSSGDTSIIYSIFTHTVSVNDPHNLLGTVTADYKIVKPFIYVTFHITPIYAMDTSNLSVAAMDDHRAFASSLIINAIKFS